MLETTRDRLVAADTIVAIATPAGRSGLGIVRMSGPETCLLVEQFFRSPEPCAPRLARFGRFGPPNKPPLDHVVLTVFQGPHSYTGEDVAEISAHGNPLILNEIVATLVSAGARCARGGEFTLRALRNGKLDLTQAEAIGDFIEAETAAQARAALRQIEGGVSARVRPFRAALVSMVAQLEARVDFSEDEDVPADPATGLCPQLGMLGEALSGFAASAGYGRVLAGGLLLAIVGRPNVGKSSLFNRLVAKERAIVTEVPGTTRDVVTESVVIHGIPLRVADTAGLRETSERVEAIGVERTLRTMADADLTVLVLDGSEPLQGEDRELLARLEDRQGSLIVVNKQDRPAAWDPQRLPGSSPIRVSAHSGHGCDSLEQAIATWIGSRGPETPDEFLLTSERQAGALRVAAGHVAAASRSLSEGLPEEVALVDLHAALAAVGEVTGETTNEEILDQIFSNFCIGK
jgi:tRNA modification GTPase